MAVTTAPDIAESMAEPAPLALGDPMGTPVEGEQVLWKGRPDLALLARHAFHTHKVALYFAALVGISLALGNTTTAIVCAVLGVAAVAILTLLAWISRRTTLYILTDTRLILRIGMAIETRVTLPLKLLLSADLRLRGRRGHGDIAMTLGGDERLLGYALLWPHVRPWRFARPEPMLRVVPDAARVAELLAEQCARHAVIERGTRAQGSATPAAQSAAAKPAAGRMDKGPSAAAKSQGLRGADLEGAPA
ncbi:photosynthetic complex putative assembly protein PuhB [Erythrobacter sp.]|jgi:hypothetical protein|uniref:photosynthetic complex putative assembly protein PuhB n=1 Tax=Erythrobacter sp. TaxID=1042 RepID=UPI002EBE9406|nr:photosynthetic complex putative assembly protein PuhB [Erythrobacter sp.]